MTTDAKKVQSVINAVGRQVQAMRAAQACMNAVIEKFTAASPSVTGTPLAGGNLATLSTALAALNSALNSDILTALIAAIVPSHEGKALD